MALEATVTPSRVNAIVAGWPSVALEATVTPSKVIAMVPVWPSVALEATATPSRVNAIVAVWPSVALDATVTPSSVNAIVAVMPPTAAGAVRSRSNHCSIIRDTGYHHSRTSTPIDIPPHRRLRLTFCRPTNVTVAIFSLKMTQAELWLTLFRAVKVAATLAVEAILLLSNLPDATPPPRVQPVPSLVKPVPAAGVDVPKILNDNPDSKIGCCEMAVAKPLVVASVVVLGVC